MNDNQNYQESQSQNKRIMAWLNDGNTITSLEALNLFGCLRLASRISDLRSAGANIASIFVKDENTGKRYKQYSLAPNSHP